MSPLAVCERKVCYWGCRATGLSAKFCAHGVEGNEYMPPKGSLPSCACPCANVTKGHGHKQKNAGAF